MPHRNNFASRTCRYNYFACPTLSPVCISGVSASYWRRASSPLPPPWPRRPAPTRCWSCRSRTIPRRPELSGSANRFPKCCRNAWRRSRFTPSAARTAFTPSTTPAFRARLILRGQPTIRVAEQMDADYVVFGDYDFDGKTFTAKAQLLDMKKLRLAPTVQSSGPLTSLIDVQTDLAWQLLNQLPAPPAMTREQFLKSSKPIRLDAFENYIRGILATNRQEKLRHFREAIRLNPNYALAMLQLGRLYYDGQSMSRRRCGWPRYPRTTQLPARRTSCSAWLSFIAAITTRRMPHSASLRIACR